VTAFTKTFSAAVRCFGASPPDAWHSYNWSAFNWGYGTAPVPKNVVHQLVSPTVASTQVVDFRFVHLLPSQPAGSTAAIGVRVVTLLNGQQVGSADGLEHGYVQDPNGYYRVFPEDVTDVAQSSSPVWAAAAAAGTGWTPQAVTSTVWS